MTKTRFWGSISLIALILSIALLTFPKRETDVPLQTFPALSNIDCAPWDGAAFTVVVKYDPATEIYISIWKAPDIKFSSTFELPDANGQVGNAYILPALGPYVILNGNVTFQNVSVDRPIEGWFSFTSERGDVFNGRFIATWGDQFALCG